MRLVAILNIWHSLILIFYIPLNLMPRYINWHFKLVRVSQIIDTFGILIKSGDAKIRNIKDTTCIRSLFSLLLFCAFFRRNIFSIFYSGIKLIKLQVKYFVDRSSIILQLFCHFVIIRFINSRWYVRIVSLTHLLQSITQLNNTKE